jgi:hypothetical protein
MVQCGPGDFEMLRRRPTPERGWISGKCPAAAAITQAAFLFFCLTFLGA